MSRENDLTMEQSLKEMNAAFDRFVDLTDPQLLRLIRGVALDLFGELVKGTPVDTGWAKANWYITLNQPEETEAPRPADLEPMGDAANKSLARAAAIAGYRIDDIIWITNNVPYIVPLATGHSQQAPNGWIEAAIARIRTKVLNLDVERRAV